jgi:hypothetical protein
LKIDEDNLSFNPFVDPVRDKIERLEQKLDLFVGTKKEKHILIEKIRNLKSKTVLEKHSLNSLSPCNGCKHHQNHES